MTKNVLKSIVVLALWILPVFLSPFTPTARAQVPDWSFRSSDLDADGLPNGVEDGGWCNSAGCFQTYPLDSDSDNDGLTDGQEKLFETDPLDDQSPGVYVEYEDELKTRQYYAKDHHSPSSWGWQQHGDRFISTNAVVVRRGTSFSVGGPADATIQVVKSLDTLTTLTLANATLLQADVTANDATDLALLNHFGLFAPPAILFFGEDGTERRNYRLVGYMDADDFLEHLKGAMGG